MIREGFEKLRFAARGWCLRAVALALVGALTGGFAARSADRDVYPDAAQAASDLSIAVKNAAETHKRIIVDFGGNWCSDCRVLDTYFHDSTNGPILAAHFILVHVNIGHMDSNLAIAERYQIPLKKGVPALAVLDERGALLYSQRTGEFEAMRNLQAASLTEFLKHWTPSAAATGS